MSTNRFAIGDLVWAKMEDYPLWPAQIIQPPRGEKLKSHHFVLFFGIGKSTWVSDTNIDLHSEQHLEFCKRKRSAEFQTAVDKILSHSKDREPRIKRNLKENYNSSALEKSINVESLHTDDEKSSKINGRKLKLVRGSQNYKKKVKKNYEMPRVPNCSQPFIPPHLPLAFHVSRLISAPQAATTTPSISSGPPSPSTANDPPAPSISIGPPSPSTANDPPAPSTANDPPAPIISSGPPSPSPSNAPPAPTISSGPPSPSTSNDPPAPSISSGSPSPSTSNGPPSPSTSNDPPAPSISSGPPSPSTSNGPPSPSISSGPPSPSTSSGPPAPRDSSNPPTAPSSSSRPPALGSSNGSTASSCSNWPTASSTAPSCSSFFPTRKTSSRKSAYLRGTALPQKHVHLPPDPQIEVKQGEVANEIPKVKHVPPTTKKIGFLGLGAMGSRLVKKLIESGHNVTVWNRTSAKCCEFEKLGAKSARSPAAVANASDIIFSCLSDAAVARSVVLAPNGILKGMEVSFETDPKAYKGYVEMTSLDPETSVEIAEAINVKGGKYLEAPITGSSKLAEEGSLFILASGSRQLFNDCETCFHAIARHLYFVGSKIGESAKYNLTVSSLAGTAYAAMAETLSLAEHLEVSQKDLLDILQMKRIAPTDVLEKGRRMIRNDINPITALKYKQQDMALALQMSQTVSQSMPVTAAANEAFKHARFLGYGDYDVSTIYQATKY